MLITPELERQAGECLGFASQPCLLEELWANMKDTVSRKEVGTGEMGQQLRTLALSED